MRWMQPANLPTALSCGLWCLIVASPTVRLWARLTLLLAFKLRFWSLCQRLNQTLVTRRMLLKLQLARF